MQPSKTGGRLLLTRCGAEAQTRHNDLVVTVGERPGYFSVSSSQKRAHFDVTSGLHLYVHYSSAGKKLWAEAFMMGEVQIPPTSFLVGHGYLQYAGSQRRREHSIRYHSCLTPESYDLPNAVAAA